MRTVIFPRSRLSADCSRTSRTENDTLARIGTACFQQLLEDNVKKLSPEKWELVVGTFIQLFSTTTARQLFDETLRAETTLPEDGGEAAAQGQQVPCSTLLRLAHPYASCSLTNNIQRRSGKARSPYSLCSKTNLPADHREVCFAVALDRDNARATPKRRCLQYHSRQAPLALHDCLGRQLRIRTEVQRGQRPSNGVVESR